MHDSTWRLQDTYLQKLKKVLFFCAAGHSALESRPFPNRRIYLRIGPSCVTARSGFCEGELGTAPRARYEELATQQPCRPQHVAAAKLRRHDLASCAQRPPETATHKPRATETPTWVPAPSGLAHWHWQKLAASGTTPSLARMRSVGLTRRQKRAPASPRTSRSLLSFCCSLASSAVSLSLSRSRSRSRSRSACSALALLCS